MKIVIAGAGEMGSHLAKMLSGNGHDITVIDSDPKPVSYTHLKEQLCGAVYGT